MAEKKSFLNEDTPSFTKVVLTTVASYNILIVFLGLLFFSVDWCWEKFKNWVDN